MLPNGTQCNIVVLSGTVKIFFRGVSQMLLLYTTLARIVITTNSYLNNLKIKGEYNVPMEIFLSNTYPFNPPKAFVRPTNDMEIKLR